MSPKERGSGPPAGPPPITADLPPPPYPMGIVSEYSRHTTPITLRIRELKSSFSGDDFRIKDAVSNSLLFSVNARALSFSRKKTLVDHTGRPLFEFYPVGFFSTSYQGSSCGPPSKLLFNVDKIGVFNPKLEITFDNLAADGRREMWVLRGAWLGGSCQITTQSGFVVASISRDYANFGQIFCKYAICTVPYALRPCFG